MVATPAGARNPSPLAACAFSPHCGSLVRAPSTPSAPRARLHSRLSPGGRQKNSPAGRASPPTVAYSSLPFGPDLCWLWGEDPGDTGHMAVSAVSPEAAKAAGPTELWGMGCEESILGSGMFQSRGVVSKWLVDMAGCQGELGPGPRHCPCRLLLHAVDIGRDALEAASGQGRGPARLQGDHSRARSTGSGPPCGEAAAAQVCWRLCSLSTTPGCPMPLPVCAPVSPISGETEALQRCGTPFPCTRPQRCCPGSPRDSWPAAGCCGLSCQQHRPPRSPLTRCIQIRLSHSPSVC